jgi:hypothetical protein
MFCLFVQKMEFTLDPITDIFRTMHVTAFGQHRLEATAPWGFLREKQTGVSLRVVTFGVVTSTARDAKRELPGVGAVFVEEAAGGAVVGLLREADDGDCALFDGLGAGVVVEVGCGEAGADGVNFDLRVATPRRGSR